MIGTLSISRMHTPPDHKSIIFMKFLKERQGTGTITDPLIFLEILRIWKKIDLFRGWREGWTGPILFTSSYERFVLWKTNPNPYLFWKHKAAPWDILNSKVSWIFQSCEKNITIPQSRLGPLMLNLDTNCENFYWSSLQMWQFQYCVLRSSKIVWTTNQQGQSGVLCFVMQWFFQKFLEFLY